jgi:hypothetical protein
MDSIINRYQLKMKKKKNGRGEEKNQKYLGNKPRICGEETEDIKPVLG